MALKDESPAQTLDTLGRVCPYPLLLTKKAMEKLSSGQSSVLAMLDRPRTAFPFARRAVSLETVKVGQVEIFITAVTIGPYRQQR
jgi:TusA-related sulfurtransferase